MAPEDPVTRRVAAAAALALAAAALGGAAAIAVAGFPRAVPIAACAVAAAAVALSSAFRRGPRRTAGLALAVLLLVVAGVLVATGDRVLDGLAVLACAAASVLAARVTFAVRTTLPRAPAPRRAVLFMNPRSGGGKAERLGLADEARARGIEAVELRPGDDLRALAQRAVTGGADGLAMAGGDGSQAIVACTAAANDLPYACIPAGTRNHFALDLGVDRDDVVGALDAFVDGGETRVDLAEVNGRIFVNNVSLGLYADAVQRPGYRESKLRTVFDAMPDAVPSNGHPRTGLRWTGPGGREEGTAAAILVSNNAYRLGRAIGSGTRPTLRGGVLGVTVFDAPGTHAIQRPWREWTVPRFDVESGETVNAGVDGEAAVLAPPLRFVSLPGALRVRVARRHPGASPSAAIPGSGSDTVRALWRVARGRDVP